MCQDSHLHKVILMDKKRTLSNFLDLSEEGCAQLKQASQLLRVKKHEIAVRKGEQVSGAFIVTQGCLRVFSYMPNGSESTFYHIRPGETCVFAINCLFNRLLYPAWVMADEDTDVYIVKGGDFKELFKKESSIQDLTISALSSAVFKLMTEVEQIQGWTLSQRVINLLLNQADDQAWVYMTQQDIAGRLGTSREVVARILSELSSSGLICTGRGKVNLVDTSNLVLLLAE